MKEGGISGMNGIIVGMAELHGMEGVSLLGETSGYLARPGRLALRARVAFADTGLKIDMTSIEERAKEAQQIFSQVQRMTEQNAEEVRGTRDEGRPGYIG